MNNSEFFEAVRLLGKEKHINEELLLEGIQRAIVTAVKRDYNNKDIVFCEIDKDEKSIRVFVRKNVVSEIIDPDEDMLVEQAQRFKKNALPGDIIEIELENDVLKVDGNLALAWSKSLDFTVERSGKTLVGSAASGEGLVNVYRGTGKVLLAPVSKLPFETI